MRGGHTFDVVHLFDSSWILEVLALQEGLFNTGCGSGPGIDPSCALACKEVKSSSNSPGCTPSLVNDELMLKMDSRQSLATSRASGSAPGANSTAFHTCFECQKNRR